MNKNLIPAIIITVICKLLALIAILGFVLFMITFTGKLACLWLLWLLLAVDFIPTYEIKTQPTDTPKETKND
jgi:hypothetical protein